MLEFYPEIRLLHITAVLASGALFAARGLGLLLGARWPRLAAVRYSSYIIDTVLLTAAMMLMTIVRQYPFVHGWLTVKVVLLVVYILLGVLAFRSNQPGRTRLVLWICALLVYLFIISVARAHHPLGFFLQFSA